MSLDLTISEPSNFRTNDKGQTIYTVTILHTFGNEGYTILDNLGFYGVKNGQSMSVDALDLLNCLDLMKEQLEDINKTGADPLDSKAELEISVKELEHFIKENEIYDVEGYGEKDFKLEAWY